MSSSPGRVGCQAATERMQSTCSTPANLARRSVASFLPGFDRFVTSVIAGVATRSGRPLPGQDLHLLEQRTLTAHVAHYTRLVFSAQVNCYAQHRNSRQNRRGWTFQEGQRPGIEIVP